jgi:hypothetical protein
MFANSDRDAIKKQKIGVLRRWWWKIKDKIVILPRNEKEQRNLLILIHRNDSENTFTSFR